MQRLISLKAVADLCEVHHKTVSRWVREGTFPSPAVTLPGGALRWYERDVLKWMIAHENPPATQTPVKGK